jgi:hypothetical protein
VRERNRRSVEAVFLFLALLLAGTAFAEDSAVPYKVEWPKGWEVSHLPTPTLSSGKNLGGERVRAIRIQDDRPAAVLELSWFPRGDGGKASLDEEFDGVVKNISEAYKALGMTVKVERKTATLGSLPDREATVKGALGEVSIQQWMSMAFSKEYIYSLTFSGQEEEMKKSQADFEAVRHSLTLR